MSLVRRHAHTGLYKIEDAYYEVPDAGYSLYFGSVGHRGQSWKAKTSDVLHDVRLPVFKNGAPPGNCYVDIYASTGTHGSTAKPTGSALASSDAKPVSSFLAGTRYERWVFSGTNKIDVVKGTVYIVVLRYTAATSGNYIDIGGDNAPSPFHLGNPCSSINGSTWTAATGYDFPFEVRTEKEALAPPGAVNVSVNNAAVTISGDRARVTWEVSTLSTLPSTWKIERKKDSDSWTTLTSSYSFTGNQDATSLISWNTWLPYIYYLDTGLVSSSVYQYRITGGDSLATVTNSVTVVGTTYYVKNGGSDGADGLSDTNAWASLSKANGTRSAGDLVLFKKGSTWTTSSVVYFSGKGNGTAVNPIMWGAYDTGNLPAFNITDSRSLYTYNNSHWVFDELDIKGGTQRTIMIYATASQTSENIKILRCSLDYSAVGGFGACIFATEADASNAKTATGIVKEVEVAYCYIESPTLQYKSAVKPLSASGAFHCHNTFMDQVAAGFDSAGGDDHRMEFCVTAMTDYSGSISPESSKWHSQQHWSIRPVCRHNLIYDSEAYGIAFETTQFGLCYGNTMYVKDGAYAGHMDSMFWNSPERPHRGNFHSRNIAYYSGSWGGAKMINIADRATDNRENFYGCPKDEWYKTFLSKDNCYFKTSGDFVMRYDTYIPQYDHWNTETEFNDNFAAYTDGDINDDPVFTNISTKDFTLQGGSPCPTWGYTEPASLALNFLCAFVTDLERNKIYLMYDKDLDESLTDTSLFTPSGGKTVTNVEVEKYLVIITVNSDYASTDSITIGYTGSTNKIHHFNLDAGTLVVEDVDNSIYTGLSEELTVNGDFTDGWSGDDPIGWTVYGSQDADDYVNYNHEFDANGFTTYTGAKIKRTSIAQYMRKTILDGSSNYEIGINIAKMTGNYSNRLILTGFTSDPLIYNQDTSVNGAHLINDTTVALNATIDTDLPPSGLVTINGTDYQYTAYSGSIITISPGLVSALSGGESVKILARGVFYFTRTADSTTFGIETQNLTVEAIIRWISVRKIL